MNSPEELPDMERLRIVALKMDRTLRELFGPQEYFSVAQINQAMEQSPVSDDVKEYVRVMFTDPEKTTGFLQNFGASSKIREVRKHLVADVALDSIGYGGVGVDMPDHGIPDDGD